MADKYAVKQQDSSAVCTEDIRDIIKDVILKIICTDYFPFTEEYHYSYFWQCVFSFAEYLMLAFGINKLFCHDQRCWQSNPCSVGTFEDTWISKK